MRKTNILLRNSNKEIFYMKTELTPRLLNFFCNECKFNENCNLKEKSLNGEWCGIISFAAINRCPKCDEATEYELTNPCSHCSDCLGYLLECGAIKEV